MPGFVDAFVKWLTADKKKNANGLTAVEQYALDEELKRLDAESSSGFRHNIGFHGERPGDRVARSKVNPAREGNPFRYWQAIDGYWYIGTAEYDKDPDELDGYYQSPLHVFYVVRWPTFKIGKAEPPLDSPLRMSVRKAAIAAKAKKKKQAAIGFAAVVAALTAATVGVHQLRDNEAPAVAESAPAAPVDPAGAQPVASVPPVPESPQDPAGVQPVASVLSAPVAPQDPAEPQPVAPTPVAPQNPADGSDLVDEPTSPTTQAVVTPNPATAPATTTAAAPTVNPIAGAQGSAVLCDTSQSAIRITQTFIMRDFVTREDLVDHFNGAQATMTLAGGAGTTSQDTATVSGALVTFEFVLSQPMRPTENLIPSLLVGGVSVPVSVNSIGYTTGRCTY